MVSDPTDTPDAADVFAPSHIHLKLSPSDVITVLETKGLDTEVAARIREAADMQTKAESRATQLAAVERTPNNKYRTRGGAA